MAKKKLSLLFLVGNLSQVTLVLLFGYLSDKGRAWVMLLLNVTLVVIFNGILIYYLNTLTIGLYIGFVGIYAFHYTVYMMVNFMHFLIAFILEFDSPE